MESYLARTDNPEAMWNLAWFNPMSQVFSFLLPALLTSWLLYGAVARPLWLRKGSNWFWLSAIIAIGLAPLVSLSEVLNRMLIPAGSWAEKIALPQEEKMNGLVEGILNLPGAAGLVMSAFTVLIAAPVCEEIAFRGVLQPLMARITKNIHVAIWLTAAIFSLIHFQFYGFIPRLLLGALFGYLAIWTGTLWAPMLAHFAHNAVSLVAYRITGNLEETSVPDVNAALIYLIMIAGIAALVFLKRRSVFNPEEVPYGAENGDELTIHN
jgi:membrane protease YdiL (CAAX protease family)